MPAKVIEGTLVLRQWTRGEGLSERALAFDSLDALYAACLGVASPSVIDRIIVRGRDDDGHDRQLMFAFQSVTVSGRE